jgi:hypothetical protein
MLTADLFRLQHRQRGLRFAAECCCNTNH